MPKIVHVKRAHQRYATVPVLDAEGKPTSIPLRRPDGGIKLTKHGRPITRRVTREDHEQPLPPRNCGACGAPIEVGTAYKWVAVKQQRGDVRYYRHEACPSWKPWELSNSWVNRVARALDGYAHPEAPTDAEDYRSALNDLAEAIRELAGESQETAENIEEGFGHATEKSEEAAQRAEDLEAWADEIDSVDIEDAPEQNDDGYDPEKDKSGDAELSDPPPEGWDEGESDESFAERLAEWRSDCETAIEAVTDSSPL